jgi:hypothetical protein
MLAVAATTWPEESTTWAQMPGSPGAAGSGAGQVESVVERAMDSA